MTSEVVVMNRLGIALASDSAATVYNNGRAKVYHADKLFMLSSQHPVGVMIYNNSQLLGVPWETILKMYRKKLGLGKFDTLEEYAADLIKYIDGNDHLFPLAVQDQFYLNLIRTLFNSINEKVKDAIYQDYKDEDIDLEGDVAHEIIQEMLTEWRAKKDIECFDIAIGAKMAGKFSSDINQITMSYHEAWKIKTEDIGALRELMILVISKEEILTETLSGLVIAGFGENEYFPVMQAFELGEIYEGKLKYKKLKPEKIDSKTPSIVKPYAESEMVDTFLNGISPPLELKLIEEIGDLIIGLPAATIDLLSGISKKRKQEYKDQILPNSKAMFINVIKEFYSYRIKKHLDPIRQSIAYLPKNELAHVAASLVNLNSFQKRMSISEDETVGGPIDVAVISKGDGFVWIERKHYFRKELNHHFFRNYGLAAEGVNGGNNEKD